MIKEFEIEVKGHRTNFNHYKKLGYDIEFKKPISIKVDHLMPGSTTIITAICDNCFIEKKIEFRFYNEYTKNLTEKYYCNKCNNIKRKETCIQKWGVENPMKSQEVKEKLKNSLVENYGVDHYSKTDDFKKKIIKNSQEKWGVDNVFQSSIHKEKIKSTNLKKLGVEYPQQNQDVRKKTTESFLNKFGVDRYSKTDDFKNKIIKKSQEKWGVDNFSQTEEFKIKTKHTSLSKWGVEHYSKTKQFKESLKNSREFLTRIRYDNIIGEDFKVLHYQNSNFKIFHKECKSEFEINRDQLYQRYNLNVCLCTNCLNINLGHSNLELEMQDFLNSMNLSYNIKDKKILSGKELDIYIPEFNLAIEMNGIYWHSEIYLDKYYHRDKTLKCKEFGIDLLHIWEDDWKYKREIIKSIIRNKLGKSFKKIYARKCEIRLVSSMDATKFLNDNHIQGASKSQLKLGLYNCGELVSLMTFGFRFTNSKKEYELIRFCNKINYNVIGSASKLFTYFLKNNRDIDKIISYADISLFNGNLYKKLGFSKHNLSKPNYFWVVDGKRKHRFNYNKKRLIKLGYDENKSESEIMHENGYFRVYSCGQEKWIYNFSLTH